jgi:hypothetical protein
VLQPHGRDHRVSDPVAGRRSRESDDERCAQLRPDVAVPAHGPEARQALQPAGKQVGDRKGADQFRQLLDLRIVRVGLDRGDERRILGEVAERVVERRGAFVVVPATAGREEAEREQCQKGPEPAHRRRG